MMGWRHNSAAMARWGGASVLVVSAHAAIIWAVMDRKPAQAMPAEAPAAIMIELAAAPEQPPLDVAAAPPSPELMPEQEETKPPKHTEREPVAELPPPTPQHTAAVVLPPATEPVPPEKPTQQKAKDADKRPEKKRKTAMSHAAASPTFQARRAEVAAAQSAGASQAFAVSPASWKSELVAQLNRHKRYPSGATGTGTATIAFTLNRSGEVTSARLVGSSGDSALDQEALALPRRASPLPAPPAGLPGTSFALNVPIRFSR
jgi:protein TonB